MKRAIVFIAIIYFGTVFAVMPPKPGLYDSETGLSVTTGDPLPVFPNDFGQPLGGVKSTSDIVGIGSMAVILIDFPDRPADTTQHPASEYDSMIFSTGTYPTGSLNDFFIENSYGLFSVGGDVAGWHTTSNSYSNYDDNNYGLSWGGGEVAEAAAQLADFYVNYALYDNDGPDGVPNSGDDDGFVDAFTVIHSGLGAEETGSVHDIWSHASYISYLTNDPRYGGGFIFIDRYTIQPEERLNSDGDTLITGISVVCHEYGHVLGLPDFYDPSRYTWGIGYWGLMGYGAWGAGGNTPESPAHLCAWSKIDLGWIDPINVTANLFDVSIPPIESAPAVYKIWRDGNPQGQYFLVENRQQIGFDFPAPGHGLLIWHYNVGNWPAHNRLELEQADGLNELDQGDGNRPDPHFYHELLGDDGDPFPGSTNNTRFGPDTNPSSNDDNGVPTGVYMDNISETGDTISAHLIIDYNFPPPVSLEMKYVCNGVELQWSNPTGASPEGYNVYRRIGTDDWIIRNSAIIPDTAFADEEIILGQDFQYRITAMYGPIESDPVATDTYYLPDPAGLDYLLVGTDSTDWLNFWYKSILDSLGLEGEMVEHILPYCGDNLSDLSLLWLVSYPPRPQPLEGLYDRDIALMDYLDRGGNVYIDDFYLTFWNDSLIFNYLFFAMTTCVPYPFMGVDGVVSTFAEGLSFVLSDTMWSSNINPMLAPPEGGIVLEDNVECGCVDMYVNRQGYRAVINTQAIHEFLDGPNGTRLDYFDRMMYFFGLRSSVEDGDLASLPGNTFILKAYPNPFNARVRLVLNSTVRADSRIEIFDITGRKIKSLETSGNGTVIWDGLNSRGEPVSSGVYFARIVGDNHNQTMKLTLLR